MFILNGNSFTYKQRTNYVVIKTYESQEHCKDNLMSD